MFELQLVLSHFLQLALALIVLLQFVPFPEFVRVFTNLLLGLFASAEDSLFTRHVALKALQEGLLAEISALCQGGALLLGHF
jgi:hypothetical protein